MSRGVFRDLTGQQFTDWTVLYRAPNPDRRKVVWQCRCACGAEKPVQANNLLSGRSKRCTDCGYRQQSITRRSRQENTP